MFNWFGNRYPYSDIHSLNLDWILEKMKETAAQAMKAVADAANALAQVADAKAAALSAQTAAQDAQTAAGQAAVDAASAAANAVQALNAAQTAHETATAANNKAQTAQESATAANSAAQTAQETATAADNKAQTAQETATAANNRAQSALDKFPVQSADIANGAVLAANIGAFQITSGKIAPGAVSPEKLGPNEMRLKDIPAGYSVADASLTITYNGGDLIVNASENFYNVANNHFDTLLARLSGSAVAYPQISKNKIYEHVYVKTPVLFYTSVVNTDIRITCGLYAPAGENVEFDIIIHNNGDGTGTTTIDSGNPVILGDSFACEIRLIPFACELHRAAK